MAALGALHYPNSVFVMAKKELATSFSLSKAGGEDALRTAAGTAALQGAGRFIAALRRPKSKSRMKSGCPGNLVNR